MTQQQNPCPICGGIGEHYAPCGEVGRWSSFDLATEPSRYAFMRVTMEGDKLVCTPISAAKFYATSTPTGDQS
jgi:hypothetical protein